MLVVNQDVIKEILEDNGIFFDYNELDEILELDSLQFVSLIISIEDAFNIEIPDHYLDSNNMNTIAKIRQLIIENLGN